MVLVADLRNAAVVGQSCAGALSERKLGGGPAAGSGDRGVRVWVLLTLFLALSNEETVPLEVS